MKSFFAVTALAGLAAAQTISSLPKCGQVCINNMLAAATALGCPPKNGQPDALCLCANVDFSNGIRDCVIQSCPAGTDTNSIIAFGLAYCNAAASSASAAKASATGGAKGSAIATSTEYSTITSDSSTITKAVDTTTIFAAGAAGVTAITTKPIVSTKSDGSKTTIGSTTIYSSLTGSAAGSAASAASSKSESAASAASSAVASASSVASSAASAASSVASSAASAASSVAASASSAAGSAASAASSGAASATSSAGAMPMFTLAAQAFAGVAGVAAVIAL